MRVFGEKVRGEGADCRDGAAAMQG